MFCISKAGTSSCLASSFSSWCLYENKNLQESSRAHQGPTQHRSMSSLPRLSNLIHALISPLRVRLKKGESNESVTQTAARWGSLQENGRMTSVASQSMAAPGPPEAWDTRQVQVRKINRWRDLFLQPCRPPSKKRPPVKAAVRLDRESGPFCTTAG